jgi:hypothetical protein
MAGTSWKRWEAEEEANPWGCSDASSGVDWLGRGLGAGLRRETGAAQLRERENAEAAQLRSTTATTTTTTTSTQYGA